jgi:hypothetical protein
VGLAFAEVAQEVRQILDQRFAELTGAPSLRSVQRRFLPFAGDYAGVRKGCGF